jgi:hypothetical protein
MMLSNDRRYKITISYHFVNKNSSCVGSIKVELKGNQSIKNCSNYQMRMQ